MTDNFIETLKLKRANGTLTEKDIDFLFTYISVLQGNINKLMQQVLVYLERDLGM
jgi:hypothetical protein